MCLVQRIEQRGDFQPFSTVLYSIFVGVAIISFRNSNNTLTRLKARIWELQRKLWTTVFYSIYVLCAHNFPE